MLRTAAYGRRFYLRYTIQDAPGQIAQGSPKSFRPRGGRLWSVPYVGGEVPNGSLLIELCGRNSNPILPFNPIPDRHHGDRVSTELKKIVVESHGIQSQRRFPDLCQLLLDVSWGGWGGACRWARCAGTCGQVAAAHFRIQTLPIDFAGQCHRHDGDGMEARRYFPVRHIRTQTLAQD